jgi:tetratricopeptide (TPR) repeat protein
VHDLLGRDELIERIERDLPLGVTTLVGPTGAGKSALAATIAGGRRAAVVELEDVKTESGAVAAVCRALAMKELRFATVAATVAERLDLVVLDGVEGVRSFATDLAIALEGRVLVTAMSRLGLASERVVQVIGLDRSAGIALLERRVRQVLPEWSAPTEAAELVRELDGLPLAIELTAHRIAEIGFARAADDPFAPDVPAGPDRPPRHRTLEAAFAWASGHLSEATKELARELAVFRGELDRSFAGEVCPGEPTDAAIDELARSSLLVRNGERYRFVRAVRHFFARSTSPATERAHARFFAVRGRDAAFELHEGDASKAGPLLDSMREDLRSAFERSLLDDPASAVALALGLDAVLLAKSDDVLHEEVIARAFEVAHRAPFELRMNLERVRARALFLRGRFAQARELVTLAHGEARRAGHHRSACELAMTLSAIEREGGDPKIAEELARATLDEARAAGDRRIEVRSLHNLASALLLRGEMQASHDLYLATLALARDLKASRVEALALSNLGLLLERTGDFAAARERFRAGVAAFAAMGDELMANKIRVGFARASVAMGEVDGVLEVLAEVQARARALGDHSAFSEADLGRGRVFEHRGELGRARVLYEDALAAARLHGLSDLRVEAEAALAELAQDRSETVRVAPRASWFEAGESRVDLGKRPTLRRILARLVEVRLGTPGRTLSVDELREVGWPGERMTPTSGAERVYSAIRTLRSFGLREVLLSRDGGYLLDPTVAIARA